SIMQAACSALVRLGAKDDRVAAALEKLAQGAPGRVGSRMVALLRESFDRNRGLGGEEVSAPAAREEAKQKMLDQAMADLESADAETRGRAINSLSRLGSTDAAAALIRSLKDPEERIRCGAIRVLAQLEAPEAIPALIECLLEDPSAYVRRTCAGGCGSFADERITA